MKKKIAPQRRRGAEKSIECKLSAVLLQRFSPDIGNMIFPFRLTLSQLHHISAVRHSHHHSIPLRLRASAVKCFFQYSGHQNHV